MYNHKVVPSVEGSSRAAKGRKLMKVLQKQLQFIGLGLWIMLFIAIAIAWWSGKGDAKSLLLNISASVIAAFAFYWMIDVLRRTREAVALAPYVIKQINDL